MKLSSVFTDHMVIQQGMPIRIFGEGKGKVTVDFLGIVTEYASQADKWCITYPEASYGGPYDMKVTLDDETVVLKDIFEALTALSYDKLVYDSTAGAFVYADAVKVGDGEVYNFAITVDEGVLTSVSFTTENGEEVEYYFYNYGETDTSENEEI